MSAKKRSAKRGKTPTGDALRALQKKARAPAGDALRALEKKSRAPDNKTGNPLSQPQNRWQRAVRYTWDKNRGRG
jgi:hypothetical protein